MPNSSRKALTKFKRYNKTSIIMKTRITCKNSCNLRKISSLPYTLYSFHTKFLVPLFGVLLCLYFFRMVLIFKCWTARHIWYFTGQAKWISRWRGHGTLKSTCRPPWLADKKKSLNSRCSRMAKIVTFWSWWQLFNSSCFETFYFPLFPFSFCYIKKWRGQGRRARDMALLPPSGVAGPVSTYKW